MVQAAVLQLSYPCAGGFRSHLIVTGGASGIGLGIAKLLLGAGMNVVTADIRRNHLEAVVAELEGEDRVLAIQVDVTDHMRRLCGLGTRRNYGLCSSSGIPRCR